MKKLAIKSHITRGKEVIELLKMMGGCESGYCGGGMGFYYYISQSGNIEGSCEPYEFDNYIVYTLEEFWEKYPFKVGDKVLVDGYNYPLLIMAMRWDDNTVKYLVSDDNNCNLWYTAEDIKDMNKIGKTNFMQLGKTIAVCFNKENYESEVELQLGDYEIVVRDGKTYAVLKKPKYPTTFEECLNMLYCKLVLRTIIGHKAELLFNLEKLLICRDAYWKIAGEQMGLRKLWNPDDEDEIFIICHNRISGIYKSGGICTDNFILSFPTAEMRDVFYENFKDLIELCKELL